jgi:zinc transport system ATP-binding protein
LSVVLELHDVRLALAGRPVLHGVDLTVTDGEFVALMGANGSGKSTLVRAATGLRPVSGGRVALFGTPLADFRSWERVGFVPQREGAGAGVPASVREIVTSGRLGRRRLLAPLSRGDRRAVTDALEVVGLADRAGDRVSTLSGGQQRRVLIARALAGEPDVFFLDEPTAGVDVHHQHALADALGILKGRGATVVLVEHELGPLAPLVDRAAVMTDGRITYDGPRLDEAAAHSHHHPQPERHDRAPHVGSPLDSLEDRQ